MLLPARRLRLVSRLSRRCSLTLKRTDGRVEKEKTSQWCVRMKCVKCGEEEVMIITIYKDKPAKTEMICSKCEDEASRGSQKVKE